MSGRLGLLLAALALAAAPVAAQVQLRLGDPARVTYSELHEALRPGTPAADTVTRLLRETSPRALWAVARAALADRAGWNEAFIALTRLAELAESGARGVADTAHALAARIGEGAVRAPPGRDAEDLLEPLRAIELAARRRREGDAAVRADILARVPAADYGLADAWTLGRIGDGTADTLVARLRAADNEGLRVRWLTLLSFSADPAAIPFLARLYAAPDSAGIPLQFGARASDALLWIGTRDAVQALLDARARARDRGVYADPRLGRGGYDFLANDSSMVVSRTGRWLTEWLALLR